MRFFFHARVEIFRVTLTGRPSFFKMMSEMVLIVCSFIICLNDLIKRMSLIDLLAES